MRGRNYELRKTHEKKQREESMQRKIYIYDRKKRENNFIHTKHGG